AASFAPLGWWPAAVPATALVVLATRGRGWRGGLLVGFAAGVAEFIPVLWWLHVVTPAAWIALAIVEAAYLAALGAGLAVIVGRVPGWPLWSACLWVAEELVRDRWPLGGFSWGRLAFSQPNTPFTGYAALGGAALVTFAVALSAGLLAATVLAVVRRTRGEASLDGATLDDATLDTATPDGGTRDNHPHRHEPRTRPWLAAIPTAVVGAAAVLVVPLLGTLVPRPTDGPTVQLALVQGNVPQPGTHFLGRAEQVLDNHVAETAVLAAQVNNGTLPRPELVLWPENASDVDPFTSPDAYAKIQQAAAGIGVPILVGAVLQAGPDNVSNTAIVWDPVTGPGQRYTKRHLVPFGEYIPWRGLIDHLTSLTSLVPQNFVPGHSPGVLQVGPVTLADVMCFEVAFDEQVRDGVTHGGQLIVVQTNNATYLHTPETHQQLAMSQLRAVEHGRSVVVASTSGISAVIAPDGRVLAQSGELTTAIIDRAVVTRDSLTVADHLGAWPEWVIAILGVFAVVAGAAASAVRRRFRKDVAA
ncbi:MAG: apolipoprotein N-acyltransferase, partial [Actinomycetota bacterium]|nr:apolipoprotein N-acyltransferase [Actinomycetota bacterium]